MPVTTCPHPKQLHAYAVGLLNDEQSDTIAEHLDHCHACQASIATLDDADDTLVTQLKRQAANEGVVEESECVAALDRLRSLTSHEPEDISRQDEMSRSLTGSLLGEYRLLEEVGRGGMGRVYRAVQTKLDRTVAVKVLPYSRRDDDRAIARFESEMKAIGRLDHPHIVRAYDAREIDGKPVLVMEFVEGMDLSRVLASVGRVKMADACELVRQAALGLEYARENGLIHRDVKPSNLMLTPQGNVKLLDLGLARFERSTTTGDEMTGAGQPIGTADYIAPEQVSDSRAVDIRADIYSLGCTLYKLLAGQAPFTGPECRGTFDKLTAHVSESVPPIRQFDASLPVRLGELLETMLAKSPDNRPATPAVVAGALEPFCAGHNLAALQSQAAEAEKLRSSRLYHGPIPPVKVGPSSGHAAPSRTANFSSRWFGTLAASLLLLVGAAGFALGVIITIQRNNTKTSLEVPDGSRVTVTEQGDDELVRQPKRLSGPPENESSNSKPTDDLSDEELLSCDNAARAIIEQYDSDGDAMLTWSEWRKGTFDCDVPDFDASDRADPTELTYWVRKRIRRHKPLLRTHDTNRDGVLTADEWSRLKGDISSADANNDGRITTTELAFYFTIRDPARRSLVSSSSQSPRRLPVIMVRTRDSRWKGDCFWPVDAEGILLPPGEFSPSQTREFLRVDTGKLERIGPMAGPFGGPAVAGAARIAVALGDDWKSLGLEWIVVRPQSADTAEQSTEPTYVLLAKGADPAIVAQRFDSKAIGPSEAERSDPPPATLILWGHAPGSEAEGEMMPAQKIAQLLEFVKQHGPLDRSAPMVIHLADSVTTAHTVSATPALLDFRIATTRKTDDAPGLSEDTIGKLIEQLATADNNTADTRDSQYRWLECDKPICDDITSRKDQLISASHDDVLYLLVSNEPGSIMLASEQGERAWRIVSARAVHDHLIYPAISIELDAAGGRLLGKLTEQNLNRPLAMVIDNKVVMVATIRSEITNQVQITGQLALEHLERLVKSIHGIDDGNGKEK